MAEKRKFIEISESESSDEESILEIGSSTSCDDDDDEEDSYDDESELSGSENEEDDDEEFICNNAVQTVRGKSDVQELKLDECKVYLRRYGLRLSGTKKECIERMKEHRRFYVLQKRHYNQTSHSYFIEAFFQFPESSYKGQFNSICL